jgi:hypothetical protein
MIPTAQTKIRREAEKKYITNSNGFFTLNEPHKVLTPIIKKNTENNKIIIFLIHIKTFM